MIAHDFEAGALQPPRAAPSARTASASLWLPPPLLLLLRRGPGGSLRVNRRAAFALRTLPCWPQRVRARAARVAKRRKVGTRQLLVPRRAALTLFGAILLVRLPAVAAPAGSRFVARRRGGRHRPSLRKIEEAVSARHKEEDELVRASGAREQQRVGAHAAPRGGDVHHEGELRARQRAVQHADALDARYKARADARTDDVRRSSHQGEVDGHEGRAVLHLDAEAKGRPVRRVVKAELDVKARRELERDDLEHERSRMLAEIGKLESVLKGAQARLSNEKFVSNAPENVVQKARENATQLEEQVRKLGAKLAGLGD